MELESAIDQWRQGERRLRSAAPERRATHEQVTEALVEELRRRLGGRFTALELAELYRRGTDWCLEVAMRMAPEDPWAWDSAVAVDAAFDRYVRQAVDYAGGKYLEPK